jgi:hypothetical protein
LTPTTGWDNRYIMFSDDRQMITIAGGATQAHTQSAYYRLGDLDLWDSNSQLIDPTTITSAVTFGGIPQQATVLYGAFDTAAIDKKLTAAGYKQQGTTAGATLWLYDPNTQPRARGIGNTTLDAMAVASNRIIYGTTMDVVNVLAAPPSTPLSTNTTLRSLASCLGPAKASGIEFQTLEPGGPVAPTPLGVGLVEDSITNTSEELCVAVPDSSSAANVKANWGKEVQTGTASRLGFRWSTVFTDPQATTASTTPPVERLTVRPKPGARLETMYFGYFQSPEDVNELFN